MNILEVLKNNNLQVYFEIVVTAKVLNHKRVQTETHLMNKKIILCIIK